MRHSLSPGHIVRLAAHAPAQGLHPPKHAVDIFDRETEKDPARGTGSALSVCDEAHFRVTDAEADEEGRAVVWHARCLCGAEQPGIEGQETVQVRGYDHWLNGCSHASSSWSLGAPGLVSGLEVKGRLVRAVHVERGRAVLVRDPPRAADLAEAKRGPEPQRAAELGEAVAERDITAGGDRQVAGLVADEPPGVAAEPGPQRLGVAGFRPFGDKAVARGRTS
jgi:hypothetical protein